MKILVEGKLDKLKEIKFDRIYVSSKKIYK